MATNDLTKKPIEELESSYETLYRERFAPTLKDYSAMAAEALALQVAIYTKRLAKRFKVRTRPKVITFSARESLGAFKALIEKLEAENIKITEVIYDPARQEFNFFAEA